MTIVHHPGDARIAHREIPALLQDGMSVTFAAPFSGYGVEPPAGVTGVDVRRARGRRRLAAVREARVTLRRLAPEHDVVLLHDPELLLAAAGTTGRTPVIWDVHEDFPGAVESRDWIPGPVRPVVRAAAKAAQDWAEKRFTILLAEDGYVPLFHAPHPVVPNSTRVPEQVPPPASRRVVYLGSVTQSRGVRMLVDTARLLKGTATVDVYGPAHDGTDALLEQAQAEGALTWHGFTPNDVAMRAIEGAAVGVSFVRDEPNYRFSRLTKLMEYLAHGVPVVTTPLPTAKALVEDSHGGVLVPFEDPAAAAAAITALLDDDERRHAMAAAGHAYVQQHHNWNRDALDFADHVRRAAQGGTR